MQSIHPRLPIFLCLLTLLLPGCSRQIASREKRGSSLYEKCIQGVTVGIRKLSSTEQEQYFGATLDTQGIASFQLTIHNGSSHTLALRPSYISIPVLHKAAVIEACSFKATDRALYLCMIGTASLVYFWPGILLIGIPCNSYMQNCNERALEAISKTILDPDSLTIDLLPFERAERFFFCNATSYMKDMEIGLFDMDAKELIKFRPR